VEIKEKASALKVSTISGVGLANLNSNLQNWFISNPDVNVIGIVHTNSTSNPSYCTVIYQEIVVVQ
jgi:hypothetical protein